MMNFHDMLFLFCVSLMFISIMHIVFFQYDDICVCLHCLKTMYHNLQLLKHSCCNGFKDLL